MIVAKQSNICQGEPSVNVTDGREACPKFWIAIYSRPNSEKKLAEELSRLGMESYVPVQTQLRQWSDRKKVVDAVIIPMTVFVHISAGDVAVIRTRPHVIRILTYPGQKNPAIIPDSQIERLKFMLRNADSEVSFEPGVYMKNDAVEVVRGKLKGLAGQVERTADGKTNLIISVEMLGGAKVSISPSDLKPLNK